MKDSEPPTYAMSAKVAFLDMLGTLDGLAEQAQSKGLGQDVLEARLAEDMFTLELQFRVALNQPLLALQQVGAESVALETDTYRSFAEIRDRIAVVRAQILASDPATWKRPEDEVELNLPNGVRFVMSAEEDIRDWILPNFYFHVTMAYALLRREGLNLGKMDFLSHMERFVVSTN